MKKLILIVSLLGAVSVQADALNDVLQQYVSEAYSNNLALQQKEFSYAKSMAALDEARSMFMPSLSIEARYSRAGGGRQIEFPLGDLLNGVYATLNDLTGQQRFPQIENVSFPFLREEEHDTKLRLVQPVFQPAIYHNYKLKSDLSRSDSAAVAAYKTELAAEVKKAYLRYLQSLKLNEVLAETDTLLLENIRVSESLFQNDMVTRDAVLRARSERLKIVQQRSDAQRQKTLAASYVNFLLNRDLDEPIEVVEAGGYLDPLSLLELEDAEALALKMRPELQQLDYAVSASRRVGKIAGSAYLPNVNVVVDYGFQGEEYAFTAEDDYWMANALLSWNLFNGFGDAAKKEHAEIEARRLESQLQALRMQIRLQVRDAWLAVDVGRKNLESARQQALAARESFQIVNKRYEQGVAPHIEYLDARNAMTRADIDLVVARYDYHMREAELQRVLASEDYVKE